LILKVKEWDDVVRSCTGPAAPSIFSFLFGFLSEMCGKPLDPESIQSSNDRRRRE